MDDFEGWYRMERPRVLAACVALAGDVDAAREATDEAFARALERWPAVTAMAAPGGWVQTVALNCLRRGLRRRRREVVNGPVVAEAAGAELPDGELWAAVRKLPRRQQAAVVLRYVHDLSYEQIAATMSISKGAVGSTLASAKVNLESLLSESVEESVDG